MYKCVVLLWNLKHLLSLCFFIHVIFSSVFLISQTKTSIPLFPLGLFEACALPTQLFYPLPLVVEGRTHFSFFFFQKGTNRSTLKEIKQINIIVRKKSMVAAKLSCSAKVKLKQLLPKKENIRCKSKRDMCRFSVQRWMPCFCVTKQMLMLLKPWSCSIFTEKINNRQFFLKGQIMRSSCSN